MPGLTMPVAIVRGRHRNPTSNHAECHSRLGLVITVMGILFLIFILLIFWFTTLIHKRRRKPTDKYNNRKSSICHLLPATNTDNSRLVGYFNISSKFRIYPISVILNVGLLPLGIIIVLLNRFSHAHILNESFNFYPRSVDSDEFGILNFSVNGRS